MCLDNKKYKPQMSRYSQTYTVGTNLNPISDLLVFLEYMVCEEYLINTVTPRHNITKSTAKKRVKSIVSHIKVGMQYIKESIALDSELSFLPAYYGILNFMKVYVLLGPYHANLSTQRWHGAIYPVNAKDSQSLLTEQIILKKGGALPLFYKTVTGNSWQAPMTLKMSDIYPYITGIGAEYRLATQSPNNIKVFIHDTKNHNNKNKVIHTLRFMRNPGSTKRYSKKDFKLMVRHKRDQKDQKDQDLFVCPGIPKNTKTSDNVFRNQFRPYLIYNTKRHNNKDILYTPLSSKRLLLPEELPIALMFFHMSSIVRYKPEFLYKIKDSRYWPMITAARQHSIYRMLNLFWSYYHQQNLILKLD